MFAYSIKIKIFNSFGLLIINYFEDLMNTLELKTRIWFLMLGFGNFDSMKLDMNFMMSYVSILWKFVENEFGFKNVYMILSFKKWYAFK